MKFTVTVLTTALVLGLSACSSSSDTTAASDTTTASAAAKPDQKVIDAVFSLDAALRDTANKAKTSPQQSTVLLELVANNKVDKSLTVAATATDGAHIEVWNGTEQRASAEDLELLQKQIEITSGKTSVCLRLASDPTLFITDVPAMKEQLKQYPKASGITEITTDGTPACGKGKPE
jgi:hypothetical protein